MSLLIIRAINAPLALAVKVSRAVADGDLTLSFDATGTNETAQLLHALQDMQTSLVKVIGGVLQGSDSVATASAQIAQGTNDLSSRTEEQASALEQTAASMEQLTATVKQNSDSARQANQLAMSASSVAIQGGEVVAQVVDTMKGWVDFELDLRYEAAAADELRENLKQDKGFVIPRVYWLLSSGSKRAIQLTCALLSISGLSPSNSGDGLF